MANGKRSFFLFFVTLVAIALGAISFLNRDRISFPLVKALDYESPYLVRDFKDTRYVLDKQRTRIIVVDKKTNVIKTVLPQGYNEADRFYYADDFMVDENGWVYVKEGAWDGNRISREAILVYDQNGCYKKTFSDTKYTGVVNKHKMMLLKVEKGKLDYAIKNDDNVCVISLDLKSGVESTREFPFSDAFNFVNDMTKDSEGNIYLLDKAGRLFLLENNAYGKARLLLSSGPDAYPNWIEASGAKKLLYAELYTNSVMELDLESGSKRLALDNSGAVTVTPVCFSSLEAPNKNNDMLKEQAALLAVFGLFLLCVLFLVLYAIISFFRSSVKVIQRISVYVTIVIFIVGGTITYKLTGAFSKVMRVQILAQMENMAYSVANTIRPSTLDSIQSAADFASEDYRQMILNMQSVIDPRLEINKNIYCDIFKYDEKHGAYACAYLDQAIGTYFPITEGEAAEIKQIYESACSVSSSKDDTSASYTYVSVPVVNDFGRVCAVVSVMTENFMLTNKIRDMKKNVLLGMVVTLIFVWLAMGEALSYILSKSQAQMEMEERLARGESVKKSFPHYYIRVMVFALFAAYNMTTTFLPMVIAKGAFESLGAKSGNIAAALPISVNLFIIGLMALFCEGFIRRMGCRKIVVIGAVLSALSNLLIFFFPFSYVLLFFSLVIDGIGVGLTSNSLYLMVSQIPDAKNRTSGYTAYNAAQISGINFGMLCGAALASNVGRRMIFPIVSVMWIVSALLFLSLWKSLGLDSGKRQEEKNKNDPKQILNFLSRRRVWTFILLIQAPFALMGSFVYYYLPLYSDANGLSEVMVAALMMLYSFFAIYLGNGLTKWVIDKTGPVSPYASILLSLAAVLVFALNGSFIGLLVAIFILGLANGFGRSVQQAQFSMLEECEEYGVPNAMGIFNFTDFIGQSFGPAVMGLVFLSRNMKLSTFIFVIALALVCLLHLVINLTKKKYNRE
ncbi:MAG: MFS transporter [Treponema sp.]|nr:MFS transporter [Treponema sp.]